MNIYLSNPKNKNFNNKGSGPSTIRSLTNESGAALIVALLLMIVMVSLVPVAIQLTSGEFDRTETFQESREAFFIADAGIERTKSIFAVNKIEDIMNGTDQSVTGNGTNFSANGTLTPGGTGPTGITGGVPATATSKIDTATHQYTQVAYNGGTYMVRVWDNADSAMCPKDALNASLCTAGNANPELDTANEAWVDRDGFINVESIGTTADGATKTIHAKIKRKIFPPSVFPAAVTLTGPQSIISTGGGGFNVYGATGTGGDGYGIVAPGDTPVPDTDCPGQEAVSTESGGAVQQVGNNNEASCTDATCMAGSPGTYSSFVGATATTPAADPDIETGQESFTGVEGEELRTELIPNANVINGGAALDTGTYSANAAANFGTLATPLINYYDDSLDINGNLVGYGVLIVDGNLSISGNFTFYGVILIGACDPGDPDCTCSDCPVGQGGGLVGTGSAEIYGAMLVGNAVNASVNFTGSADIYYSCAAINLANDIINLNFETVAWKEID